MTMLRGTKLKAMLVCLFSAAIAGNGQTGATTPGDKSLKSKTTHSAPRQVEPHDIVEKEILNELRQIRVLLERQQQQAQQAAHAPPVAVASPTLTEAVQKARVNTNGFAMGSKDAPITIVEFADYQCPFCRQFHSGVFGRLKKDYIDTGRVRFISRDLPLDFHTNAFTAAEAARCAGEQNQYWEMRDALITHADNLAPDAIAGYAAQLGVDRERFRVCIDKQTYSSSIRADADEANSVGITGTPSFVIGTALGNSLDGEKVVGALSYEEFQKIFSGYEPGGDMSKR